MPHCVVVGCNNQAKKKDDPSVRFHCFPEKPELYRAWVNAVKRITLQKDPRVCSKHFERSCFDESYLIELQLMGSSRGKKALKPDAIPTIFPHKPAKPGRLSSVKRRRLQIPIKWKKRDSLKHCHILRRMVLKWIPFQLIGTPKSRSR